MTYGSHVTVKGLSEKKGRRGELGRRYNGRGATVRGFDRDTGKYLVVLDSPKVEALTTELMALNPKALRKRVREFSEEHGVEGHIMRRAMRPKTEDEKEEETQQRMVSLILLNGGAKTKTLELSQKNMCAAFSSPSCWYRASVSIGARILSWFVFRYDPEKDQDLKGEMRQLRSQLQLMRTALWQSKSQINTAIQAHKREADKNSLMAALRPKKKSSVFGPDGRPIKRR